MKTIALTALLLLTTVSASFAETRCGWFENPTPGNAWLIDKDGEWTIAIQGAGGAMDNWPDFKDSQWVATNGSYGYGCTCMKVRTGPDKHVAEIYSSIVRPLSACRKDKTLRTHEPKGS